MLVASRDANAGLEVRVTKFSWDKNDDLRATFAFRDAIDDSEIRDKIRNGLPVTVVMRGYVYQEGGDEPVALTAYTCKIAYQLWDEVYKVVVNNSTNKTVVDIKGVYRLCTDMSDLLVVSRKLLKSKPTDYYLAIKVEVNPLSAEMLQKVLQWITRTSVTSTGITVGDSLFATFVGVFMKNKLSSDKEVDFRTADFPM